MINFKLLIAKSKEQCIKNNPFGLCYIKILGYFFSRFANMAKMLNVMYITIKAKYMFSKLHKR